MPGLRLSRTDGVQTRLSQAEVDACDWMPGTVKGIYGRTAVADIAALEHVGHAHGLHPGRLPAALPLNPPNLVISRDGDDVVVLHRGKVLAHEPAETLRGEAPGYYFIDIQPDQLAPFTELVQGFEGVRDVQSVPMLRGRITAMDGVSVDQIDAPPDEAWILRGDRGITYSGPLPERSRLTDIERLAFSNVTLTASEAVNGAGGEDPRAQSIDTAGGRTPSCPPGRGDRMLPRQMLSPQRTT